MDKKPWVFCRWALRNNTSPSEQVNVNIIARLLISIFNSHDSTVSGLIDPLLFGSSHYVAVMTGPYL